MRRTWMVLFLALLPAGAAAQGASAPADAVAAELARVNATLKEIATLLNRQSDLQGLDLLMKRVQLGESNVTELERRLRTAQDELRGLEGQRSSLELQMKVADSRRERATGDYPKGELEMMATQSEEALKRLRQRAGQLMQEIAALESEIGTRRDDLRSWQTVLDRRLARHAG
jgi:chromosome segregation ATPase